jgi:hypothetical protein
MAIYLIQGFFFQNKKVMGVGMGREGSHCFFEEGLYKTMYAGILYPDPGDPQELIGEMMDEYGKSILVSGFVCDDLVEFIKQYEGRKDFVKYEFTKKSTEKSWTGFYQGPLVGKNYANCVLTEISEELFIPRNVEG